jgi:high-affinity K+ transport system ATPase subunit B
VAINHQLPVELKYCPIKSKLSTNEPGESFLDKMIALVEGASRQKNANCVNYFVGCQSL